MADSDSEFYFQSDTLGLKNISNSIFNIPGFLIGFSSKGASDNDSVRSPTSPLDFKVFANPRNPFSFRAPRSPSQSVHQKKWDCSVVGLGIVNSLANETKPTGEIVDPLKRKNIVFGSQVKTSFPNYSRHFYESLDSSVKSNSLPRNYMISPVFGTKYPNPKLSSLNGHLGNEGVLLESEPLKSTVLLDTSGPSSSPVNENHNSDLSSKFFCPETKSTITSEPLVIGRVSQVENSSGIKSSSLPIPIGSGHGYVGSLSAREIELSEDYTCIISHGPNPKTTHIFGDCILECHASELASFDNKEEQVIQLPQVAKCPEDSTVHPVDEFLSFCYFCKKKLEIGKDIYMYRDEKAFCSFDCRDEQIFVEEEMEKACNNSSKSSSESSDHEDLFLLLPFAT